MVAHLVCRFTLFTLGVGDYRPNGAFWQMLTALCAADGLLTITLSVTYFVPLVSAATRKRQIAASISRSSSASVSRSNSKGSELKPLWVVLKTNLRCGRKQSLLPTARSKSRGGPLRCLHQ
jgi:hypothetical protein